MTLSSAYVIVITHGLNRQYWQGWTFTDYRPDAFIINGLDTAKVVLAHCQGLNLSRDYKVEMVKVSDYFNF